MTTLAGVEAEAGLDTLVDVVGEVEMETTVCTLVRKEVKELSYTLPRLRLSYCQRHGLTG